MNLNQLKCFVCLILSLIPAIGQEPPSSDSEKLKDKGRTARFVCSTLPEGLENPVTISAGKDLQELVISKYSLSLPVKIPTDGIIRLVRKINNSQNADTPQYVTLASIAVPENVNDALVILVPLAKNSKGLVFQSKVQDIANFKAGETMFLNLTNLKVGIELGKNKILAEPGQVITHSPLGSSKFLSLPISVNYYEPSKKQWLMITASTVALYSTRRELCIFIWDSNFNRVDYESVSIPIEQPVE